jgi:Tol biopolymer transport system component
MMDSSHGGARSSLAAVLMAALAAAVFTALLWQPEPAEAAFPGTNGRIAFASDRGDSTGYNVFTMGFTGDNVRRLTSDSIGGSSPAWSPDGKKIAFVGYRGSRSDIYVMDVDGSDERLLTDEAEIEGAAQYDADPAFSPDGRTIVFSRGWGPTAYDLYEINVDGSDFAPLFLSERVSANPTWSPDGERIAFNDGAHGIRTVRPDAGGLAALGPGHEPDWSPDGDRLAFALDEGLGESEIYKMDADGSDAKQLTRPEQRLDRYIGAGGPAFSPGGGKIAFHDGRDGDGEIFMINADGTREIKLTRNRAADYDPAWQPVR